MSIFPLLQGIGRAICMFILSTSVYHEAFWANQSRVPASLLNAFNGHLTTPCLLNVSPSTLRPHALLPRPNCRGFDWPRELVSPNSMRWLAVGMHFFAERISAHTNHFRYFSFIYLILWMGWCVGIFFSAGFWGLFMTWTEFVMHRTTLVSNQLPTVINCECVHVA